MKTLSSKAIALCLGVFVMSLALSYLVIAWSDPAGAPPTGNIFAPINTSGTTQTKSGGLNIGSNVGIGTTEPNSFGGVTGVGGLNLHIVGKADNATRIGISGGNEAELHLIDSDYTTQDDRIWRIMSNDGKLTFAQPTWNYSTINDVMVLQGDGNVGVGTASPTQKLDVNGYVKGRTGLCIGDDCRTSWPDSSPSCKAIGTTCTANTECCSSNCSGGVCANTGGPTCKATDEACSTNTDCCSSYCISGFCQPQSQIVNCNIASIGTGIKKIFVTGPYLATELPNDTTANNLCSSVGGGSYKALVYLGGELPSAKLPANNEFWNCQQVATGSSQCECKRVARHKLDFFTDKGGNTYLFNPIIGTESGVKMTGVRVWTNFKPDGTGGTVQLSSSTFGGVGSCVSSYQPCYYKGFNNASACYWYYCQSCNSYGGCGVGCQISRSWFGITSDTSKQWSYVEDASNTALNNDCRSTPYSRAIYCVQQ